MLMVNLCGAEEMSIRSSIVLVASAIVLLVVYSVLSVVRVQ